MTRERRQEIIRNLTQGAEAARLYNRRHARIIPERMLETKAMLDKMKEVFSDAESVSFHTQREILQATITATFSAAPLGEPISVVLSRERLAELAEFLPQIDDLVIARDGGALELRFTLKPVFRLETQEKQNGQV